jgi:uncharacterized membrane protein
MKENHLRSLVKGATWRMVGTLDTIFLSFLFTGKISIALSIGGVEVFTKILLFYLHERVWMKLGFGTWMERVQGQEVKREKHYRSIIKGISWRAIGSLDTFWIALLVNHQAPHATKTAFNIAGTEVITKVGLFWLHERIWMQIKWGQGFNKVAETALQVKPEIQSLVEPSEAV